MTRWSASVPARARMGFMDVEKTMQFILEHQAQHAVEIQQLRERDAALTGKLEALTGKVEGLTGNVMKIAEIQSRQQDMIGDLIAAMSQLADGQQTVQDEQRQTRET